jgi:hypothetical protein
MRFLFAQYRDELELLLRGLDPHLFAHAHDAFLCMKSFSLCSDTVMDWSCFYGDWTRIFLRMRMMLFTHEIFFSLLRYCDGLELVLRGLDPHLFAHSHDAFYA